ncbi:hypothetical protein ACLUS7_23585, partial [Enterobacterales bacterium BD_CKDN230030183-1A_HGKHYDSX7]
REPSMPCKPSRIPPVIDHTLRQNYGRPPALFAVGPGISLSYATTEARKLMECARYLNQTGVLLGDKRMTEASFRIVTMVKALLEEIEQGMRPSQLRARYYDPAGG